MEKHDPVCRSCIDCGVINCSTQKHQYPEFCLTTSLEEGELEEALALYDEDRNREIMLTAAQVEFEGYCKLTRVEEIMDFARRMGFRKLGIATCVG